MDREGDFRFVKGYATLPIGTEIVIKSRPRFTYTMLAAAAACLALVFSLGTFGFLSVSESYSAYIDINPSIELVFNNLNNLKAAKPLNEEGAALLEDLKLKGHVEDVVVGLILEAQRKGYLTEEQEGAPRVSVTLIARGGKALDDYVTAITAALEKNEMQDLACIEISDQDFRQKAEELGVSPGKLKLAERLFDSDQSVAIEELVQMSVKDIMDSIREVENIDGSSDEEGDSSDIDEDNDNQSAGPGNNSGNSNEPNPNVGPGRNSAGEKEANPNVGPGSSSGGSGNSGEANPNTGPGNNSGGNDEPNPNAGPGNNSSEGNEGSEGDGNDGSNPNAGPGNNSGNPNSEPGNNSGNPNSEPGNSSGNPNGNPNTEPGNPSSNPNSEPGNNSGNPNSGPGNNSGTPPSSDNPNSGPGNNSGNSGNSGGGNSNPNSGPGNNSGTPPSSGNQSSSPSPLGFSGESDPGSSPASDNGGDVGGDSQP